MLVFKFLHFIYLYYFEGFFIRKGLSYFSTIVLFIIVHYYISSLDIGKLGKTAVH